MSGSASVRLLNLLDIPLIKKKSLDDEGIPFVSVWLIPSRTDRLPLQSIINQLAQYHHSVAFCPHLTLFSAPVTALAPSLALSSSSTIWHGGGIHWAHHLSPVLDTLTPFALRVTGVKWGQPFAKTVFLHLETTPSLLTFIQALQPVILQTPIADSITQALQNVDPHISLIYKKLDKRTKVAIAQSIRISQPTICFNKLQIIQAPAQFETQADVQSLRCIYRKELSTEENETDRCLDRGRDIK